MLRIIQNTNSAGAKSYYSTADYYSEGQELIGLWHGQAAARLGLSGDIQKEAWDALCDNRNPTTGLPLTVRRREDRSVGYDFNFHPPKSVSVLYGLTQDQRILEAFRNSVNETMRDMEAEMKTRVRKDGKNEDRTTGNMVWGEFVHFTSRPVGGVPDPHLHAHCFVHNATYDQKEGRWKAGQFRELKRDAPYFEAVFHSRMSRKLAELGLPIQCTKKGWEIAGISEASLAKFSRRTALIEEQARRQGITDPEKKSELGAKTRDNKEKKLSMEQLRGLWKGWLTSDEQADVFGLAERLGGKPIVEDARSAVEAAAYATEHCFERKSVVPERELLRTALKRSYGLASAERVEQAFQKQNLLRGERDGRKFVTTPIVLAEEKSMINFARQGRGTCKRLGAGSHLFCREWLNKDQRRAVEHVLNSPDRVMLIRGAAGVGKTSMMQEAVEAIEAHGKRVFTFAPSADASRGVLAREGFVNAETVARLLVDERLQKQARGQVIWIDEAGLLGTKAMKNVFELVDKIDARVILSGDRRQHGSVERGAALRLLETEAGLVPAEIRDIQRQKAAYKQAVQALSEGRTEDGFEQLDKLGWIKEASGEDRYATLANEYIDTVIHKKTALVVAPMHLEGGWITERIRSELKRDGHLGKEERIFPVLENANFTQAERGVAMNYLPGDALVFHQNAKGYTRGERIIVGKDPLPLDQAARFQTYHAGTISIARGDVLRITRNGKTADDKHRLNNGGLYVVKGFDRKGDIVLTNGWTLAKDYGHFAHGYAITSHASQGKTVDRVFIAQSSASFPASSREQFYVSVSRARERATVFTDDKAALLDAVNRSDDRLTATEFLADREHRQRGILLQRKERVAELNNRARQEGRERESVSHER